MELIWKASGKSLEVVENDFDAEEYWKALRYRIEKERDIREAKIQPAKEYRHSWSGKSSGYEQVIRFAVVLLIAAEAGVYTWQNFHIIDLGQEEPVMREIVMDKGQRANLVLSDGTNVNLNTDSKIRMPAVYQSEQLEIFLVEGETVFDIAGDPDRPFLIHSGEAVIFVVETSFAVRAYPEDKRSG